MEQVCKNNTWQNKEVSNEAKLFQIGPLRLWYKINNRELWTAFDRKGEEIPLEQSIIPENITWSRWVLEKKIETLQFKPIFPDRAITVKPENALKVAPGAQTRVYVRIPLWLRIDAAEKKAKPGFFDTPIVVLSKTYFGTYLQGEQCYWISSGIRSCIEPDLSRPFLAICPLKIINRSEEELIVGKMCLRVQELSLYLHEGQLWANDTEINFRGSNDISHIEIGKKAPVEAEKGQLISSPRSAEKKKGFAAKTFETLKDLPGLGFLMKYAD